MCLEVDRVCILDGEDTSSKILSPLCFMLHLRPTGWEGILDLMMLQMSFTLGSIELSFLLSTLLIFLLFSSLSLHMLPYFLLLPFSPSEPWPRRLFPVWAPARFLQGEECTGGPHRVAINISSLPCLHLCRVLNDGIFMKCKYLHWKAVSQRPARVEGKIIERSLRHF